MCELKPLVLFIIFSNHYIYVNLLKYINVTTLTTYELPPNCHVIPSRFRSRSRLSDPSRFR